MIKPKPPLTRGIFVFFLIIPLICISMVCWLESIPRYISLPLHAPDYYKDGDIGDWKAIIYSTYELPILPPINGKVYLLRKEATVFDENASLVNLASYFDKQLDDLGWTRNEAYAPCQLYMPEAEFLKNEGISILHYRKKDYQPMIDYEEGDLVCLAIWKPVGESHFNIVFMTARPSLLVLLNDFLG